MQTPFKKIKIFSDKQFIMIKSRFLLATFVGIFVYTLVSFIAGRNGVICYTQLNEQKKEISLQVANIQNINNELKLEFSALEKDRDVIAAYARKLNYVSNDEKIVKIKYYGKATN